MINTNQIVPITATDLLTLLGTVMAIGQESLSNSYTISFC